MAKNRSWGVTVRAAAVLLTALLPVGCSVHVSARGYEHMLCVDSDGGPAVLAIDGDEGDRAQDHESHAREIVAAFRTWSAANHSRRIMLIVHGGLVSMRTAVADAEKVMAAMGQDPPDEPCFPIFVNWETGIGTSYGDHLFYVRGGRSRPVLAMLTWPFYLVADFGRAVARYPLTLFQQVQNLGAYYFPGEALAVPDGWKDTARLDASVDDAGTVALDLAMELLPGVLRLGTTILLDGSGVPAFRDMVRRARVLFVRDEDFDRAKPSYTGALSVLCDELIRGTRKPDPKTGQQSPGHEVPQVTIVAHSMGTIVANELLRRYGHRHFPEVENEPISHLIDFDTIVFMGAACTIREFHDTTLSFVRDHENARFYNLCLDPADEADDRYVGGILPHGSLLEWIDHFITDQQTAMDRTLGKWNNVIAALPLMAWLDGDVRRRIVVRGFSRSRSATGPHDHGDFNNVALKFWKREFWDWRRPLPAPGAR